VKDEDELDRVARERHELHVNHPTHRPMAPDYERKGLAGEDALAVFFGTTVDKLKRPGGDNGKDLIAYLWGNGRELRCKIDVKCAGKPKYLLVEKVKAHNPAKRARVYVLSRYLPFSRTARLLGWAWLGEVLRGETFVYVDPVYGPVVSYSILAGELRELAELKARFIRVEEPEQPGGTP
jgi:hypothetical protein